MLIVIGPLGSATAACTDAYRQPPAQTSQWQAPVKQDPCSPLHVAQGAPFAPHAAVLVAETHVSPMQQPAQVWAHVEGSGDEPDGECGFFFFLFFFFFFLSWTRSWRSGWCRCWWWRWRRALAGVASPNSPASLPATGRPVRRRTRLRRLPAVESDTMRRSN